MENGPRGLLEVYGSIIENVAKRFFFFFFGGGGDGSFAKTVFKITLGSKESLRLAL